jgi:Fe-S cluster biogenesis protein NfuA
MRKAMEKGKLNNENNNSFKEQVGKVIDEVRPSLEADGGGIELVEAKDGIVTVQLQGACNGCPMAHLTLQLGVERVLREKVAEFTHLEAV